MKNLGTSGARVKRLPVCVRAGLSAVKAGGSACLRRLSAGGREGEFDPCDVTGRREGRPCRGELPQNRSLADTAAAAAAEFAQAGERAGLLISMVRQHSVTAASLGSRLGWGPSSQGSVAGTAGRDGTAQRGRRYCPVARHCQSVVEPYLPSVTSCRD